LSNSEKHILTAKLIFPTSKITLILSLVICFSSAWTQFQYKGKIIDELSQRPVPFANIATFNKGIVSGTSSNIDGQFELKLNAEPDSILISCVGYERKTIYQFNQANIYLTPKDTKFSEVLVLPGENPALRIIRNTVSNRDKNDVEQFLTFSYECYTLFNADIEPLDEQKMANISDTSTLKMLNYFKQRQGFASETYSRFHYKPKNNKKEVILGSKTSGLNNPIFSLFANQIQPFSAYTNPLVLFSTEYLNPLSESGMKGYLYILQDTTYLNKDTIYIVDFQPKLKSSFSGTQGTVYINASDWSVNKIIFNFPNPFNMAAGQDDNGATTLSTGGSESNSNFATIIIAYEKIKAFWMPREIRTIFPLGEAAPGVPLNIYNTSYVRHFAFGEQAEKLKTGGASVRLDQDATQMSDSLWQLVRTENHDTRIDAAHSFLDSMSQVTNLDRFVDLTQSLIEGKLRVGFLNIELNRILNFNDFEGFRIGFGAETNERLLKPLRFGAYMGYGFRDKRWKYGGHIRWIILPLPQLQAKIAYDFDVSATGIHNFQDPTGRIDQSELIRNAYVRKMDYVESFKLELGSYLYRSLHLKMTAAHKNVQTGYDYTFNYFEQAASGNYFTLFETGAELLWRIKDKYIQVGSSRLYLNEPRFPIINVQYAKGWDNVGAGDFAYDRILLRASQQFRWMRLGRLFLRGEYQQTWGDVPLPMLIYTTGIFNRKFGVTALNIFETALPNEFLGDRLLSGFFRFEFNPWRIKKGKFEPIVSLRFNVGWGTLNNPERHQQIVFKTMEKGFYETGIVLDNLFNIGVAQYGLGVFYRLGPYAESNALRNFAIKLSLRLGS
jgi:hypothetical protein